MESSDGGGFRATGDAYDRFMGRYSRALAEPFADAARMTSGQSVLDVGCGPGALTGVLVDRLGADGVSAVDPSPPFVDECRLRHPGVDVRLAGAELLPFDDEVFDCVMSQLVMHFVADPSTAAQEFRRVLRPSGVVAACVWDFVDEMEMLRHFWDAALAVVPDAPDEARTLQFGTAGELVELFDAAGFVQIEETPLVVTSTYSGFDELWSGFLSGIGPAGAFCVSLSEDRRVAVREEMFLRLGSPASSFSLSAMARCAIGRVDS